jgi:hypothetical protein
MKTQNSNQNQIHAISKVGKVVIFAAIVACVLMIGAGSALAATNPILRSGGATFEGQCCFSWNETVSLTEGATLKPVIVTWDADFDINVADAYFAGISINGGACETATYGPRVLAYNPGPGSLYTSDSFQWIVLPTDGVLVKGTNTFELCGGGKNSESDSITIGSNTLSVVLAK